MLALIGVRTSQLWRRLILGSLFLTVCLGALAQPVGQVEFARGVGFAQTPGQLPRILGKGLPLMEGDRLTMADDSAAIIKLQDGTRMTLRPNSEMIVQQYQFKEGSEDNSMVLQLLRGGFRAVTGSISKDSPDAARIQTANATIGIHGTDFDARLCGQDCKAESSKVTEKARPNSIAASAKLISAQGDISATDSNGTKRKLVEGASVYQGDTVETGAVSKGVLIFRDESRLTLGASTHFKVDGFVFDEKNPTEGRFFVSLLRGSMRALTGLIGKANNRNVGFTTDTATIGIRGTGLDLDCSSAGSCSFFTWLGTIVVSPKGQTALQILQAGQGLFVSRTAIRPLTAPTLDRLQRPDTVPVDMKQLFISGGVSSDEVGLFVTVRDGHIEVTSSKETLQLGRGETGFAGSDGRTGRPVDTPLFIQLDKVPLPNSPNPMLLSVVGDVKNRSNNLCR
ncbi:MAG: FecR domain-containing protein [Burkholderiales bacterium]|nr:FecR domain-containing protein [Burkholderiales bacterium]